MDAHYFLTNDGKKIASGKMMIHGDFIRDIETREGVKFKTWVYHQVTNTDYKLCCECGKRLNIKTFSTGYGNTIACSTKCLSVKQGERIKQRILKKYGVDNVSRMPSVRRKAEETMLRRYGGRVTMLIPNKTEELRAKQSGVRLFQFWEFEINEDLSKVRRTIEEAISGKLVRGIIDNLKPFSLDTTPLVPPRSFSVNGFELYDAGFSFTNK